VHPSTFTNPMDRAVTELLETMTRRGANIAAWQGRDEADEPVLAVAGAEASR